MTKVMSWTKIRKSQMIFLCTYGLFFVALFLEDVSVDLSSVAKICKGIVLLICLITLFTCKWKIHSFNKMFFLMFFLGLFFFLNRDFYWLVILLIGAVNINVNEKTIFKTSFWLLLFFIFITIALYLGGVFTDVLSKRTDTSTLIRHSLGFAHSNILPLAVFYMTCFYLFFRRKEAKWYCVLSFLFVNTVLFFVCGSRNALICSILLSLLFYVDKLLSFIRLRKNMLIKTTLIFACIIAFAIIPSYLRTKSDNNWIYDVHDKIFTNRSMLGATAIDAFGIHLLNSIDSYTYYNTSITIDGYTRVGVVLDNGYLFILIRYGIIVLIFFLFMFLPE